MSINVPLLSLFCCLLLAWINISGPKLDRFISVTESHCMDRALRRISVQILKVLAWLIPVCHGRLDTQNSFEEQCWLVKTYLSKEASAIISVRLFVHNAHSSGEIQSQLILQHQFSSVQSLSHVRLFVTPWIAARQASLSITSSRILL